MIYEAKIFLITYIEPNSFAYVEEFRKQAIYDIGN